MDDTAFSALKSDIEANGLIEPIILYEDKILDGRNRYKACAELGVEPKTINFTDSDPLGYVISLNLHRRHLTESQRAMVAGKLANMTVGQPEKNTANLRNTSQADAAEKLNVSERSVSSAKKIQREGIPELAREVERGNISVSEAVQIAGMDGIEILAGILKAIHNQSDDFEIVMGLAKAGSYITEDHHNLLDCIREDAKKAGE